MARMRRLEAGSVFTTCSSAIFHNRNWPLRPAAASKPPSAEAAHGTHIGRRAIQRAGQPAGSLASYRRSLFSKPTANSDLPSPL